MDVVYIYNYPKILPIVTFKTLHSYCISYFAELRRKFIQIRPGVKGVPEQDFLANLFYPFLNVFYPEENLYAAMKISFGRVTNSVEVEESNELIN